jgi:hypothetical protein
MFVAAGAKALIGNRFYRSSESAAPPKGPGAKAPSTKTDLKGQAFSQRQGCATQRRSLLHKTIAL